MNEDIFGDSMRWVIFCNVYDFTKFVLRNLFILVSRALAKHQQLEINGE